MVAGDWRPHVPAATVGRPRIAAGDGAARAALVAALHDAGGGDLVAVTAPAGYGKSTAVVQWDQADERPFAWARMDTLDADPEHLLLHVATAVHGVAGLDPGVLRYLGGAGRDPLTDLLPALVGALELCGPLVLVFDDVHHLSAAPARDVLSALVDEVPDTVTVVLIGRSPNPVDLARRRLDGRVVEIGTEQLRLTVEEAAAVFASAGGTGEDAAVSALLDRCEGWAAGVTLAAMAVRNGAALESFTGRHHLVADYLLEEVLDGLDDMTATFLLESAVLERFCAEQLDAVLGRGDSASMLAHLVHSGNLFVIALDGERRWYRYHRLFGDLLRATLFARRPQRSRKLAAAAAEVLERDGDLDGAIAQAVAADDGARAAALVNKESVRLGFDGRVGVLARRLGLLDQQCYAECPDAAIARAWLGVSTGEAELIQGSLRAAHAADRGGPLSDGTPSVEVAVALVNSLVGVNGVREVLAQADVVRAAGDHTVNPWWGAATVMKGAALSMLGDLTQARSLLEAAVPVTGDLPGFQAAALAHLALIDLGAGDDEGSVERGRAARAIADEYDLCDLVPMVVVYAASAVTSARVEDFGAAREAVGVTEKLLDRLGYLAARTALLGHGLLAWTAAVMRDPELTQRHLEAAERARLREPDAPALAQRIERVRAILASDSRPLTAAELRLLPYLATHLSLRQIAGELLVGRETAKSQVSAIYRKLGVSSRAAAVSEAKRVGLLAH